MDTSDPHIVFDKHGHCNHCKNSIRAIKHYEKNSSQKVDQLNGIVQEIKQSGIGKEYDCLIGLSGGVDSTYMAYVVKRVLGLRPLAVHLDNGWNSKLAVRNIKNIVKHLDIDLYTHVIDWEEFKEMQRAYLRASVIDIEALTDHAIIATMFKTAIENDIKFIIKGLNPSTENILPKSWAFNKGDLSNIQDIVKKHGNVEIKTFPTLSEKEKRIHAGKLRSVILYEYIDFDLTEAMKTITEELKWVPYGGKHYESIWTRFYQGYILPRKFGVDKRRAHYSSLICLNKLDRNEALDKLNHPTYDNQLMKDDLAYVAKKFDMTEDEFQEILENPPKSHFDFKTDFKSFVLKRVMVPTNLIYKVYKYLIRTTSFAHKYQHY